MGGTTCKKIFVEYWLSTCTFAKFGISGQMAKFGYVVDVFIYALTQLCVFSITACHVELAYYFLYDKLISQCVGVYRTAVIVG